MDLATSPVEGAVPARAPEALEGRAGRVLLVVLALGVLTQSLLWGARIGLGWCVLDLVLVGAAFAFLLRGPVTPAAALVGGAAAVEGAALVDHASDWTLAVAFPGSLVLLAVLPFVLAQPTRLAELGELPRRLFTGAARVPRAAADAFRHPGRALDEGGRAHALGLLRGFLIGIPVAGLFASLLCADPSFRDALFRAANGSFEVLRFVAYSLGAAALYLVVYVLHRRARATAGATFAAAAGPVSGPYRLLDAWAPPPFVAEGPIVRPFTWTIVVAQIALVFGAFVAVHARYLFGGHALVRAPGPLTYAAYLHAGFELLLAAVVLAVVLVIVGHWLVRDRGHSAEAPAAVPGGRMLAVAEATLLLLTGITLLSCWQRLCIYEQAYGYTHLRLGVGFLQLGVLGLLAVTLVKSIARAWRGYGAALVVLGLSLHVAAAVFNADLYVARGNIERAAAGHELDLDYLAGLSVDARAVLGDPLLRGNEEMRRVLDAGWAERAREEGRGGWRGMRGL